MSEQDAHDELLGDICFTWDETPAHCDGRVIHRPGHCIYCDKYASVKQQARIRFGVNFSEEPQDPDLAPCPAIRDRGYSSINSWGGNQPVGPLVSDRELSLFERIETLGSKIMYGTLKRRIRG